MLCALAHGGPSLPEDDPLQALFDQLEPEEDNSRVLVTVPAQRLVPRAEAGPVPLSCSAPAAAPLDPSGLRALLVTGEGDIAELKGLLQAHADATGSPKAKRILADFAAWLPKFRKILPHDYHRMLRTIARYEAQGMDREQAEAEAFAANAGRKGD